MTTNQAVELQKLVAEMAAWAEQGCSSDTVNKVRTLRATFEEKLAQCVNEGEVPMLRGQATRCYPWAAEKRIEDGGYGA